MKKILKTLFIGILLSISLPAFGARTETEVFTYSNTVTFTSNQFLKGNGKIVLQNNETVSTNSFMALDVMQYPVFLIPLSGWSEVELKASTNNFDPNSTNSAVFWYESLGNVFTTWTNYIHAGLDTQLYYCNPDNTNYNSRSWILKGNEITLTESISTNNNYQDTVIAVPGRTVKDGSTNYWMYPNNDNLVWVYRRRTASYGETNNLGHTIWHPIVPNYWRKNKFNIHF